MTRIEAFAKAKSLFGDGATVGVNHQYVGEPVFVAKKAGGEFLKFGAGKTWEEAFKNVKDVVLQKPSGRFVYKEPDKEPK